MASIINHRTEVLLAGKPVTGRLVGTERSWGFQSDDPDFVALFPAGAVYSFSNYGSGNLMKKQRAFQEMIAAIVLGLAQPEAA